MVNIVNGVKYVSKIIFNERIMKINYIKVRRKLRKRNIKININLNELSCISINNIISLYIGLIETKESIMKNLRIYLVKTFPETFFII